MPILDALGDPLPSAPKRADSWEKAKTISSIISAIVIPMVLAWIGHGFTSALKERELQGKFVELAVQILREEPDKQAAGLRDWATQVLNKYSGVPLSAETKKALIDSTRLPSGLERYEGRRDLGNIEQGDGTRFLGRGYIQIVGRTNYNKYSKALRVDLISNPELAAEPKVAAAVLALWFKEREDRYAQVLAQGDQRSARKIVNGGTAGFNEIAARYQAYLSLVERPAAEVPSVEGVSNPRWLSEHLPTLIAALTEHRITNPKVKAYALATAEFETQQGRAMKERP